MLGFVNASVIIFPDPADAPVIPPVITPTVQVNVLGTVAVRGIFTFAPLQIVAEAGEVTNGSGLTVTVMV